MSFIFGKRARVPNAGTPRSATQIAISRHLMAGTALVGILVIGVGGWAATASIAGAVIAPGSLVVDSNVKKVQHQTGGIVGELRVRDGDKVKAGDVLVRLDDTLTQANLAIIAKELRDLAVRKARLEAERDGLDTIIFPPEFTVRMSEPAVQDAVSSEQRLFETRRTARHGQKAQLSERIAQLHQEIAGNITQDAANARETELARRELEGVRELWSRKLVAITRFIALEREVARLEGTRGTLVAAIAKARGQVAEIELQILQIDRDLGSEVGAELRTVESRIGELIERRIAADDALRRIEIRAPQSGTVHQSSVHTVGGVIVPDGQPIMLIVPETDKLLVEARVAPQDIDQIRTGEAATLRFSAFSQRTTPEISGTVSRISADVSRDPVTGQDYYTIRISVQESEIVRLGDIKLMPGMPVEAFVQTGRRTVLSYIAKPITDQIERAFKEH